MAKKYANRLWREFRDTRAPSTDASVVRPDSTRARVQLSLRLSSCCHVRRPDHNHLTHDLPGQISFVADLVQQSLRSDVVPMHANPAKFHRRRRSYRLLPVTGWHRVRRGVLHDLRELKMVRM